MKVVSSMLKTLSKRLTPTISYSSTKDFSNSALPTSLSLPSGQKMPILGLGTWELRSESEIETALNAALDVGYRHIDTAWVYENEQFIGQVLKKWLSSGKLSREDLFISTKLPMLGVHPNRLEQFLKDSLNNLQLDYVDLYLIHFPIGCKSQENVAGKILTDSNGLVATEGNTDHAAIWRKMEEQVDAKRTKNIGLSNYNISQIRTILSSARIKPSNLQVEIHISFTQEELIKFCHDNAITVTAYSPLANPGYNKFLERIGNKPVKLPEILKNSVVTKLGQKYSKTPAQIALRFLVQMGIAAVPKSAKPQRIKENINIFDFTLTDGEMKMLLNLEMGELARVINFAVFPGLRWHPDFPFTLP